MHLAILGFLMIIIITIPNFNEFFRILHLILPSTVFLVFNQFLGFNLF